MRILVDRGRCEGHGLCEEAAPRVFELDDEGELVHHYEGAEVPGELEEAAGRAVRVCPVAALREGPGAGQ